MPDRPQSESIMRVAHGVLKTLVILNALCLVLLAPALIISLVFEDRFVSGLAKGLPEARAVSTITLVQSVFVIALVVVPLAHIALTRLSAIVASTRAGDPFVAENARRLTAIAWALLGIMLCDLAFGIVTLQHEGAAQWGWTFSLTGWLAVLLLFVLARVFDHGARLRDEVEGTV